MTATHNTTGIPVRNSAAYKAGEYLYHNGPKKEEELFAAVYFGVQPSTRACRLQDAILTGWLVITEDGYVKCSQAAREHFGGSKPAYVGKVAEPRSINVMTRKPYVPPKRVPRADEPAYALRDKPTFYTQA